MTVSYSIREVAVMAGLRNPNSHVIRKFSARLVRFGWTMRRMSHGSARSARRWFPPADLPPSELLRYLPDVTS